MKASRQIRVGLAATAAAILFVVSPADMKSQRNAGREAQARQRAASSNAVTVGVTDIGGVVTGRQGPEAGVWVIAETTDLPTKLAKIVVTDDQGRYLVPDLPKANYNVWVRGYGLIDSPKVNTTIGKAVNLKAV